MDVEYCQFADVDIRAVPNGRTLVGIAVPWDRPSRVSAGLVEGFRPGAFDGRPVGANDSAVARVRIFGNHPQDSRQWPLGRALSLRNDAAGLWGEWRLSATRDADEALSLVADGALEGLSVGFVPLRSSTADDGTVWRVAAHLDHVALTPRPVFADARVLAVRDLEGAELAEAAAELVEHRRVVASARQLLATGGNVRGS